MTTTKDPYRPLTPHEAKEILKAHLAFEEAGGNRKTQWWCGGFP